MFELGTVLHIPAGLLWLHANSI